MDSPDSRLSTPISTGSKSPNPFSASTNSLPLNGNTFQNSKIDQKTWHSQYKAIEEKHNSDSAACDMLLNFLKKRTELELDYYRGLDKLHKSMAASWLKLVQTNAKRSGSEGMQASSSVSDVSNNLEVPEEEVSNLSLQNSTTSQNKSNLDDPILKKTAFLESITCLISESEADARARQEKTEAFHAHLLTALKDLKTEKNWITKKSLDSHNSIIEEMFKNSVEFEKAWKSYTESEKENQTIQHKFDEYNKKPKNSTGLSFLLGTNKEQANQLKVDKFKKKIALATEKSNEARNQYLFQIEGYNSMTDSYYGETIPTIVKMVDSSMYETVQSILLEDNSRLLEFSRRSTAIREKLEQVFQRISIQEAETVFFQEKQAIFRKPASIFFAPYGSDRISSLTTSEAANQILAANLTSFQERQSIYERDRQKLEKEIQGLSQMISVYSKTPEFGNATNPREELGNAKIALLISKQQLSYLNAVIAYIRGSGVKEAKKPELAPRAQSPTRENFNEPPQAISNTDNLLTAPLNSERSSVQALFDYTSQESDEISFPAGAIITIIGDSKDGNPDWKRGTYVDPTGRQISGLFPVVYTKPVMSSISNGSRNSLWLSEDEIPPAAHNEEKATAIYDFTPENAETDLKLVAGETIVILSKDTGMEGWWKGSDLKGNSGLFPKDYVQPL